MNQPERLLIIDDDQSIRETLAELLKVAGYAPETAGTGREALEKARKTFFNLAIVDLVLPDIPGTEVLASLKERHPDMECIVLTGHASLETAVDSLNKGVAAYLLKPVKRAELFPWIASLLEKQRLVRENRELLAAVQRELAERQQAEEALRESKERLEFAVAGGLWDMELNPDDPTHIPDEIHLSPRLKRFIGYEEDEFPDSVAAWQSRILPEDLARVRKSAQDHLAGRTDLHEVEYRIRHRDGRLCWLHSRGRIQRDEQGAPLRWTGIDWDITERKQAEEALHIQRDLAVALNAATDLENMVRLCLEAAIKVSGMDCGAVYLVDAPSGRVNLVGHSGLSADFVARVSQYESDSFHARLVRAGKPLYSQHQEVGVSLDRVERREGLRALAVLPVQHQGRVIACLNVASHTLEEVPVFARNLLEAIAAQVGGAMARAQTEKALHESEEHHRHLVEEIPCILYAFSDQRGGTYYSPGVESILGYPPSYLLKHPMLWHDSIHPDDLPAVDRAIEGFRRGEAFDIEYRIRNAQGHWCWLRDQSFGIRKHGDEAIVEGLARDITQGKQAEERISRQSAVLAAINRVFWETLTCETEEDVARTCLAVAEELTGSQFGFIAEVNPAGRVDSIALSDPGWEACRLPEADAALLLKDMEIRGIWSRALQDEQSQIVNDPASHPDRVGTPEGHPPITSFLGVPLKHAGRTMGLIGLANKEGGYDLADQQDAEALSVAFVEALNRKRAEGEIKRRNEELASLTLASQALTSSLDLPTVLGQIVDLAGYVVGGTHASVVLLEEDGSLGISAETFRECPPLTVRARPQGITRQIIARAQPMVFDEVSDDGTHNPALVAAGVRSYAGLPLMAKEQMLGVLFVHSHAPGAFRGRLPVLIPLANQAAIAIENARLYEAAQRELAARQQVEETLRESERKYRTLVENLPQKVFLKDRDSVYISCNSPYAQDLGISPAEIAGKTDYDFFPRELAEKYRADDRRIMESGKTEALEERYLQAGQERLVHTVKTPVRGEGSNIVGILGIFWDITERKRMEEERQRYAAELEERNEEIKQFAYIVSHDLRAPLVNLKGFAAELHSALEVIDSAIGTWPHLEEEQRQAVATALQEDIPEALGFIDSSVTRMDHLVQAVLQLSRLGRSELKLEPVALDPLVREILKNLAYQIEQRQVKVSVGPLPEVVADRISIEQILSNLLTNAVLYLDPDRPGEVEITGERGLDKTTVRVRDNGRGIAAEEMDKVFAPFRRAGKPGVPGEGMGLAYVQTLVRRHGGRIECESELGVGTTFTFTLSNHLTEGGPHA